MRIFDAPLEPALDPEKTHALRSAGHRSTPETEPRA